MCLYLFSYYKNRTEELLQRPETSLPKAKNIYCLGLYSRSLLTPGLDVEQVLSSPYNVPGTKIIEQEGNQQEVFLLKKFKSMLFRIM